jgi:hypothetical protein
LNADEFKNLEEARKRQFQADFTEFQLWQVAKLVADDQLQRRVECDQLEQERQLLNQERQMDRYLYTRNWKRLKEARK